MSQNRYRRESICLALDHRNKNWTKKIIFFTPNMNIHY